MAINKYTSITTFSVNGLNAPMKRHRVADRIRKHDSHVCGFQETRLTTGDSHRLKVKGWNKIFQANGEGERKAGVAILTSDELGFKMKTITRDKEGHYLILKGCIRQEDRTWVNIDAPKYI